MVFREHIGSCSAIQEDCKRTSSRVLLSKSGELISTKSYISVYILCSHRPLLLLSISCGVIPSNLLKDYCDY